MFLFMLISKRLDDAVIWALAVLILSKLHFLHEGLKCYYLTRIKATYIEYLFFLLAVKSVYHLVKIKVVSIGEMSVYLVKIKVVSITGELISYHFTSD